MSLTAEGERLLSRVAPHLEALEQALRPYGPRRDDILSLSLTPSMASVWLVPRLGAFLAAHPQLEINLQSSAAVVDFERDRDVDAALRIGRGHWPGVIAEHLFDEWVAPVASPDLVERMGGLPGTGELQHWPLLGDPGHEWGHGSHMPGGSRRRGTSPPSMTPRPCTAAPWPGSGWRWAS